jgi:hypothetical protein
MAFIKIGDNISGKITHLIESEKLTDEQKEAVAKKLADKLIKKSADDLDDKKSGS